MISLDGYHSHHEIILRVSFLYKTRLASSQGSGWCYSEIFNTEAAECCYNQAVRFVYSNDKIQLLDKLRRSFEINAFSLDVAEW